MGDNVGKQENTEKSTNKGALVAGLILLLFALAGIGYGIWYAVTKTGDKSISINTPQPATVTTQTTTGILTNSTYTEQSSSSTTYTYIPNSSSIIQSSSQLQSSSRPQSSSPPATPSSPPATPSSQPPTPSSQPPTPSSQPPPTPSAPPPPPPPPTVRDKLREVCPVDFAANGKISVGNGANYDDYLFSGCTGANKCDAPFTEADPISKRIINMKKPIEKCGSWALINDSNQPYYVFNPTTNKWDLKPVVAYTFYQGKDIDGYNIEPKQTTLENAIANCTIDPNCKGYNTDGWRKSGLLPKSWFKSPTGWITDNTKGLYIKTNLPIPKEQRLDMVGFYKECDYSGDLIELGAGNYNISDITARIGNNIINSIIIPDGFKVILYDGSTFSGKNLYLYKSIPCLSLRNFGNITSSVKIIRYTDSYKPTPKVKFFDNTVYRGYYNELEYGEYNPPDIGLINDNGSILSIRSITVPVGTRVRIMYNKNNINRHLYIYENKATIKENVNILDLFPGIYPTKVIIDSVSVDTSKTVKIYEDFNYTGHYNELCIGDYNQDYLGLAPLSISSIKIPPGYRVTLLTSGAPRLYLYDDIPNLEARRWVGNYHFSDKATRIIVEKISDTRPLTVKLFEHYNGTGMYTELIKGRYNVNELGIPANTISSVDVPDGYRLTLCDSDNPYGDKINRVYLYRVEGNLGNRGFNDKTKSVEIVDLLESVKDKRTIKFYNGKNYTGKYTELSVSRVNEYVDAYAMGIESNTIKSIQFPPGRTGEGLQVNIYLNRWFTGRNRTFYESVPDLSAFSFSDETSSILIKKL